MTPVLVITRLERNVRFNHLVDFRRVVGDQVVVVECLVVGLLFQSVAVVDVLVLLAVGLNVAGSLSHNDVGSRQKIQNRLVNLRLVGNWVGNANVRDEKLRDDCRRLGAPVLEHAKFAVAHRASPVILMVADCAAVVRSGAAQRPRTEAVGVEHVVATVDRLHLHVVVSVWNLGLGHANGQVRRAVERAFERRGVGRRKVVVAAEALCAERVRVPSVDGRRVVPNSRYEQPVQRAKMPLPVLGTAAQKVRLLKQLLDHALVAFRKAELFSNQQALLRRRRCGRILTRAINVPVVVPHALQHLVWHGVVRVLIAGRRRSRRLLPLILVGVGKPRVHDLAVVVLWRHEVAKTVVRFDDVLGHGRSQSARGAAHEHVKDVLLPVVCLDRVVELVVRNAKEVSAHLLVVRAVFVTAELAILVGLARSSAR